MRSRPALSLRRRISARLWRAERDERERQIAANSTKQRQSHSVSPIPLQNLMNPGSFFQGRA